MKFSLTLAAAALTASLVAASAPAQNAEEEDQPRINQIIVYGNDPCPRVTSGDEIVVCARRPENDRYRIPEIFREGERLRDGESWASRIQGLEYVGQTGIHSCSTVGPAGYTGCWAEMMRQAKEDRRQNAQPRR